MADPSDAGERAGRGALGDNTDTDRSRRESGSDNSQRKGGLGDAGNKGDADDDGGPVERGVDSGSVMSRLSGSEGR